MIQSPIASRNRAGVKHPREHPRGISYSLALLYAVGGAAAVLALRESSFPPPDRLWGLGFFAGFQLLLMYLSVPVTAFGSTARGYLSFDRLPIVAAILLFGPVPAAWASGGAALVYTLASNTYGEDWRQKVPRAFGNGGMFLLSTLAAGYIYLALGGTVPADQFTPLAVDRICVLIFALQGVNETMHVALNWRGMNSAMRRRPVHWLSTLIEIAIAWTGVAAAGAFVNLTPSGFGLYIFLILIIAVLLKFAVVTGERDRRRALELAAVNRVNQAVDSAASLDELIEVIFREVRELVHFAAFLIGTYEADRGEVDIRLNYDNGTRHPPSRRKPSEGVLAWTIANRQSLLIADARTSSHPAIRRRVTKGEPSVSIMAVPINFRDDTVGVMSVQDYRPRAFHPHQLELLEGFAQQIAVAIVNTRLFAELHSYQRQLEGRVAQRTAELEHASASLARTIEQKEALLAQLERENRRDSLTGLANRRHLDDTLRQEHYRAWRFGHPLALALGDLDHFKRVNDGWGHLAGDKVLSTIAEILSSELRATDLPVRYGGEEFVILFPETSARDACGVCEKLRKRIETYSWDELAPGLELTISFGVSDSLGEGESSAKLLATADRALYRAKRLGRNQVCGDLS